VPAPQRLSTVAAHVSDGHAPDVVGADPTGLTVDESLRLLSDGEMEIEGRLVEASNTTVRAFIALGDVRARCVYKPVRGERPLWDFPDGTLAGREVAAYQLSHAAGWGAVPPTVLRDGPLGPGACQLWIDEPDELEPLVGFVPSARLPADWLAVAAARDETGAPFVLAHADDADLARLALFDVVVNNADRKGAHVLRAQGGQLYAVDHGVCFHVEDKLRTVLWGWIGRPLPAGQAEVLAGLREALTGDLGARLAAELISEAEVAATIARVERLLARGVFPEPVPGWPAIPWPPI
jgi:uncharacterized repeat protein (TIGR03843 family)